MKGKSNKRKVAAISIAISALALATVIGAVNFSGLASAVTGTDTTHAEYGERLKDQTPASLVDATWDTTPSNKNGWTWVDDGDKYFGLPGVHTLQATNGTDYSNVTFTVQRRRIIPLAKVGGTGEPSNFINIAKSSVTVTAGDGGTVTGSGIYPIGNTVSIKAIPNSGYKFSKWSDGNTSNPRNITVNSNANENQYTATFDSIGATATVDDRTVVILETPKMSTTLPTEPGQVVGMKLKDLIDRWNEDTTKEAAYTHNTGTYIVLSNGNVVTNPKQSLPSNNKILTAGTYTMAHRVRDQNTPAVFGGALKDVDYASVYGGCFMFCDGSALTNTTYGSNGSGWSYYVNDNTIVTVIRRPVEE